jgi:hypothetical protein
VDTPNYRLSLMVPLFDPGPIDHPEIPILLAAVNPVMCGVAGEVADGIRAHPVCTPSYIAEVMQHCEVARFEVFGHPSDEVRRRLGLTSGVDVPDPGLPSLESPAVRCGALWARYAPRPSGRRRNNPF